MFCEKCGQPLPDDALFCGNCGGKVEQLAAEKKLIPEAETTEKDGVTEKKHGRGKAEASEGVTVGGSGEIQLCPDGKYRWYYEFPMLKNPVILFTVWKIMLLATLAPALLVLICDLADGDGFIQALQAFGMVYGVAFGIMFVLSCIGYFVLAAIYGFKYIVLFEMDEKTITHAQQPRQFKKAQAISWLTVLTGAVKGSPGVMGTGILAATKQKTISEFKHVSRVIALKKQNTIKVNQLFSRNQIYVKPEDFDFVLQYIRARVPEKALH